MKQPTPTTNTSNLFEDMLKKHRRGIAANEAGRRLSEAIEACRDTGGKAELKLTVLLKSGGDDQIVVDIQVATKLPKEKLPTGLFWLGEDNSLHTSDPKQLQLPLVSVVIEDKKVQEVPQTALAQ
mgnify:CR=1 FL=1